MINTVEKLNEVRGSAIADLNRAEYGLCRGISGCAVCHG